MTGPAPRIAKPSRPGPVLATKTNASASLHVVDAEGFVGDEQHDDVGLGARSVFHDFTFRKPDERSRALFALVRDQPSLEHVHTVSARMSVPRIDDARGIADKTNLRAIVRIGVQHLAEQRSADLFIEAFFPRHAVGVDGVHGVWMHSDWRAIQFFKLWHQPERVSVRFLCEPWANAQWLIYPA